MTKPKPKPQPQKRNASTFKPGNTFGFKPKEERADRVTIADATGEFTSAALARITKLASQDKSEATIANSVGMTVKEFSAALRTNEALASAMELGNGLARDFLIDRLRRHGRKFFVSDIYALKSLHGLSDAPAQSDDNRVSVQVVLPGADARPLIEGQVVGGDDNTSSGLRVVDVEPMTTKGASPDPEPEYQSTESPPPRHQTVSERHAVQDFEHQVGIDSYAPSRNSFPSDAAYARWLKTR